MAIPEFLLSNNYETPDNFYIVHTLFPRFVLEVETQEIEWIDELSESSESEMYNEVEQLIKSALDFFTVQMEGFASEE